jgi:hypothetical protein
MNKEKAEDRSCKVTSEYYNTWLYIHNIFVFNKFIYFKKKVGPRRDAFAVYRILSTGRNIYLKLLYERFFNILNTREIL